MKKIKNAIIEFIKELIPYVVIISIVLFVRIYITTPVRVDGNSMYPTFEDGQILLLNKFDDNYKRFQVIVFKHGTDKYVKRIIGLPGETVAYKDNKLYINDQIVEEKFSHEKTSDFEYETTIPYGTYFVIGDNRINSLDSRFIGVISENDIEGVVGFSIFPFKPVI